MKTTHDIDRMHRAAVKRARKADKPHASAYSKANVHGEQRPGSWIARRNSK